MAEFKDIFDVVSRDHFILLVIFVAGVAVVLHVVVGMAGFAIYLARATVVERKVMPGEDRGRPGQGIVATAAIDAEQLGV